MIFITENLIFKSYNPRITLGENNNSNPEVDIFVTANTIHELSLLQNAMVLLGHIPKLLDSRNHFCSECV